MSFVEGHALVIGVGGNQFNSSIDVPITVRDGEAVYNTLIDPDTCAYPREQVNFLHNELATTQGVIDALDNLAGQASESDTVFIYFAGHGAFGTDNNYYLATYDAKFFDTSDLVFEDTAKKLIIVEGHGLSQARLAEKLKLIRAKKVLMIFNACHSGSLQTQTLGTAEEEARSEGQSLPAVTASALLSTGEGRVVISACKPDQLSSYQDKGDNLTWFTEALVDGLMGEAVPTDGYISVFNLYNYVYEEVTNTLSDQDPMITVLQNAGPFPVALANSSVHGTGRAEPENLLPDGAVNEVSRSYSRKWLRKIEKQNIVMGDYVEGDKVLGNKIEQQINTAGGAVFMRAVTASTVVGGDQYNILEGSPQITWPKEVEKNYLRRVGSEFEAQIFSRLQPAESAEKSRVSDLYLEPEISARRINAQSTNGAGREGKTVESTKQGTWSELVKTRTFRGLLIGDAHDGKSLLLMKIAHDLAHKGLETTRAEKRELPIYMAVSRYPANDAANADLLLAIAAYASGQPFESLKRYWYEGKRRIAMMIDDADLLPQEEQDAFVNAVKLLLGSLGDTHSLVIACRSGVGTESLRHKLAQALQSDPQYTEWVIQPLTTERRDELLQRNGAAGWLRDMVKEDEALGRIVNRPGTLSALVRATEGLPRIKAPQNLAELYGLFIDGYLFKRDQPQPYDYVRVKQPVLSYLAVRLLETRQHSLAIDDSLYREIAERLVEVADRYFHSRKVMPADWNVHEWFKEIYDSPIINPIAAQSGRFEFASPIYRDYYAALYLSTVGDDWQEASRRIIDSGLENWYDALILLSGMPADEKADELLNHALSSRSRLAADLWLEKGTVGFSRVPDCVKQDYLDRRPVLPLRSDWPVHPAAHYFRNVARDADPRIGLQVLNGIMQLGMDAIEPLLDAVQSPHPIVAASAVHALFHLGEYLAMGAENFEPLIVPNGQGFVFNNKGSSCATIGSLRLVEVPRYFRAELQAAIESVDFDIFQAPSKFELWHTPVALFAIDYFQELGMVDWIGLASACYAISQTALLIADKAQHRKNVGPIVYEMMQCFVSYNLLGYKIAQDLELPWEYTEIQGVSQELIDNNEIIYRELRKFFNRTNRSRMLRQRAQPAAAGEGPPVINFSSTVQNIEGEQIGITVDEISVESDEEVDLPSLTQIDYIQTIESISGGSSTGIHIGHIESKKSRFLAAETLSLNGGLTVEEVRDGTIAGIVIDKVERWSGVRARLSLTIENFENSELIGIQAKAPEDAYVDYNALFAPLAAQINNLGSGIDEKLNELKAQVMLGPGADDEIVAGLIDDLVREAPAAKGAVLNLFTRPEISVLAGPVARFVLQRLQK
ncbi:MAG: caspase family protein [Candidatus Promineifilaceae bacterium]